MTLDERIRQSNERIARLEASVFEIIQTHLDAGRRDKAIAPLLKASEEYLVTTLNDSITPMPEQVREVFEEALAAVRAKKGGEQ